MRPLLPVTSPLRLLRLALLGAMLTVVLPAVKATTVVPPKFAELVAGADYIVRARVKAIRYEAKDRPGKVPLIHTKVALEVVEAIAGQPPAEPELTVLGGRWGDHELRVEGLPQFEVGQEEVMFVHGNGRVFYPLYAAMHGRYPIKKDKDGREFVTRTNGVQLDDVAEVAAPLTQGAAAELQQKFKKSGDALTPAKFIEQVRTQRSTGGRVLEK